jgi:WD40 repeat protein
MAAVLSEDGRRVLAVADGEVVHLYDVAAGEPLGPPLAGPTSYCSVAADGVGRLVTMCEADGVLAVWRVASAPPRVHAPSSDLRCVAVTPQGRILAGGSDGRIDAWRLADGVREGTRGTLPGRVNAVSVVPAGVGPMTVAVGGHLHGIPDDLLHRWVDDGPDRPFPLGQGGETRQISVARAGDRLLTLTVGCSRDVLIHDLLTGEHVGALEGGLPLGVAVGDLAGRAVAAITRLSPVFQLWDIAAGTEIETPWSEDVSWGDLVHAVVDSPGGPAVVFVRHHRRVVVRDLAAGGAVRVDPDNTGRVTALSARGESVAVARSDGSVAVHRLSTGELTGTLTLPHPATALTWTPAGDLVVAGRRALLLVTM